jgi:putative ABC transport system substrate-binding protein
MKTVLLLIGFILADMHLAEAQQPKKIPRIGYVSGTGSSSDPGPYVEALRQGLRDLGHIDGKNIVIEFRGAEGKRTRIPSLVAELVQLKVDVLVSGNFPAASAAKQTTKTIPIVMVTNEDPVATKLIGSLARPGWKYHRDRHTSEGARREATGVTYGDSAPDLAHWSSSGSG